MIETRCETVLVQLLSCGRWIAKNLRDLVEDEIFRCNVGAMGIAEEIPLVGQCGTTHEERCCLRVLFLDGFRQFVQGSVYP